MEGVDLFMGVIAPYVNFFIFFFLAVYFFKKPIKKMVKQRRKDYEQLLADASQAKQDALAQQKLLDDRFAGLDAEIESLKTSVVAAAKLEAQNIVENAERLAEHTKTEAKRLADAYIQESKDRLQKELLEAVGKEVTQKLKQDLSGQQHLEIASKRVKGLELISMADGRS